jgi:cytochrome c5
MNIVRALTIAVLFSVILVGKTTARAGCGMMNGAQSATNEPEAQQSNLAQPRRMCPMMRSMMGSVRPSVGSKLPDAASSGAKLVSTYCTQCHAAPSPSLHTRNRWPSVTSQMHSFISATPGARVPSTQEMNQILGYLQQHAD